MPEGVKWRGKSVYQVLDRLKEAGNTKAALRLVVLAGKERIERLETEAKEVLIGIAEELAGMKPENLYLGDYPCETSPTDKCIYNIDDDHWKDSCLFCGDAEDRG